jgi:hypothetical protein
MGLSELQEISYDLGIKTDTKDPKKLYTLIAKELCPECMISSEYLVIYECVKPLVYKLNLKKDLSVVPKERTQQVYRMALDYLENKKNVEPSEIYKSIVWNIRKVIFYRTQPSETGTLIKSPKVIPNGFFVIKPYIERNMLNKAHEDLDSIYKSYKNLGIPDDNYPEVGLHYLFAVKEGSKFNRKIESHNFDGILLKLKEFKSLHYILALYMDVCTDVYSRQYDIPRNKAWHLGHMSIIKYATENTGIKVHMDNIVPRLGSLIVNVSLGPKEILYDLIPITVQGTPIRAKIHNGEMVFLDGRARYQYAHGIPFNMGYEKIKYTLTLRFDIETKSNKYDLVYDPITKYTFSDVKNIC